MSRSFKKTISFGKSDNGGGNRCKKTWGDYAAEKARKDGMPIKKQHHRHDYQTLQDYIEYVKNHFNIDTYYNDAYDRHRFNLYNEFLAGRQETQELIVEFATMLFNKDRSK